MIGIAERQSIPADVEDFSATVRAKLDESLAADFDPAVLAELIGYTHMDSPYALPLLNTIHAALLKRTIAQARSGAAHYRDDAYSAWAEPRPGDAVDISGWPVLTRQDVIDNFGDLLHSGHQIASISHTSGTTGPALDVYKGPSELGFVRGYYWNMSRQVAEKVTEQPLVLTFPNFYHGAGAAMPGVGLTLVSGVTDDTLIQDAAKVLTARYDLPRHSSHVTSVSGLGHHVLFFTSYLLEQGIDLRSIGIRSINITGGYTSPHWRGFLRRSWGAPVFDRFTLTESIGGATRCLRCDRFHFDHNLYPEVVDVDTGMPVREGIGKLLITCPHPFVQMQPLIRYATGDLVRRTRNDCGISLTVEFLGRLKNCVRAPAEMDADRGWLLFSTDVNDVLSALPDVRIYDWFSNVRVAKDRTVGSLPLHLVRPRFGDGGRAEIDIDIELKYAPHSFPERVTELRQRITDHLTRAPTGLAQAMATGQAALNISFHAPGALAGAFEIKI